MGKSKSKKQINQQIQMIQQAQSQINQALQDYRTNMFPIADQYRSMFMRDKAFFDDVYSLKDVSNQLTSLPFLRSQMARSLFEAKQMESEGNTAIGKGPRSYLFDLDEQRKVRDEFQRGILQAFYSELDDRYKRMMAASDAAAQIYGQGTGMTIQGMNTLMQGSGEIARLIQAKPRNPFMRFLGMGIAGMIQAATPLLAKKILRI